MDTGIEEGCLLRLMLKISLVFHPYYVYYRALSVNNSHAAHVTVDILGTKDKQKWKQKTFLTNMLVEKVVCNMCSHVTLQLIDLSTGNEHVTHVTPYF